MQTAIKPNVPSLTIGLLASLVSLANAQPNPCPITWGPIQQVSNTQFDAYVPKVVVVGDTIHLVYYAGAMYYRRSTNSGKNWDAQTEIVSSDSMSGQVWNRPLAASGRDVYFVYGNKTPSGFIRAIKLLRSTDGGGSWLQPQEVAVNNSVQIFGQPIIAAQGQNVFVCLTMSVTGYRQAFLARSTNAGATWDSARQISFGMIQRGAGDIQASGGGVYITFEQDVMPSRREVGIMVSTDFGASWSSGEILSTIDNFRGWEPQVAVSNDGTVYACWQDAKYSSTGFGGTVLVRRSSDRGITWGPESQVNTVLPSAIRSSMVAHDQSVYILWDDERFGSFYSRPYFSMSTDRGTNWCDEFHVSDSSGASVNPVIAHSRGAIHAFWSSNVVGPHNVFHRIGRSGPVNVVQERDDYPSPFLQAYPNPFNLHLSLRFDSIREERVKLSVCDILGRELELLMNENIVAGPHTLFWNAADYSTGVYWIVLQVNGRKEVKRVVLLK